jgi:hypothetical protein
MLIEKFNSSLYLYINYPTPLQYLIYWIQALTNTCLIIALAPVLLIDTTIRLINYYLILSNEKQLLSLALAQYYQDAIDAELNAKNLGAFLKKLSPDDPQAYELEDEEFVEYMKNLTASLKGYDTDSMSAENKALLYNTYDNNIKNHYIQYNIFGFYHLSLVCKAIYSGLLAQNEPLSVLSFLYYTTLWLLLLPMLMLDLLSRLILEGFDLLLALPVLLSALTIKIIVTLTINSPIYLYEGLTSVYDYCSDYFKKGEKKTPENGKNNNSTFFKPEEAENGTSNQDETKYNKFGMNGID